MVSVRSGALGSGSELPETKRWTWISWCPFPSLACLLYLTMAWSALLPHQATHNLVLPEILPVLQPGRPESQMQEPAGRSMSFTGKGWELELDRSTEELERSI